MLSKTTYPALVAITQLENVSSVRLHENRISSTAGKFHADPKKKLTRMYHQRELHQRVQGVRGGANIPHVPVYQPVSTYQGLQHHQVSSVSANYGSVPSRDASHQYTAAHHQYSGTHQVPQRPNQSVPAPHSYDVSKYLPHRFNPLRDPTPTTSSYQVPVYQGHSTMSNPGIHTQRLPAVPYHQPYPAAHQYSYNHTPYPTGLPPPPPPPPVYSGAQYGTRERYQRPNGPTTTAPPKRKRFDFYCDSCTKGFECEEDYDIHVAEDHVTCSHPGCGFSAREEVVRAHKLKHAVNMDTPEEIDAWIAMRRNKFPRKNVVDQPTVDKSDIPLSKLEKFIRNSMRQSAIEARKKRREREQKQPCVHWERAGKCSFGEKCSFAHEKTGVCTFFLNHGRCRHGDTCKYKHVRTGSRELEEIRDPRGQLMKKLMAPEIHKFQSVMLQCIRHIVSRNFYQGDDVMEEPTIESPLIDDDSICSDNDEDYNDDAQLSPISNS